MTGYVPKDRDDLLARVEAAWAELDGLLGAVPLERLEARPSPDEWAAKDHLSHLTTWLRVVQARIRQAPEHEIFGLDPVTYRGSNEEQLNEAAHRLHRDRPAADLLADLRAAHAAVVAAVGRLSTAELERPTWPSRPERGPLAENVYGNSADHYRHHAADLRALMSP